MKLKENTKTTYCLGIDPSLTGTGLATVKLNPQKNLLLNMMNIATYSSLLMPYFIKTTSKDKMLDRFVYISDQIDVYLDDLTDLFPNIEKIIICLETPFVNKNYKSSLLLSRVFGVILTSVVKNLKSKKIKFTYLECSPLEVKRRFYGSGTATKEEITKYLLENKIIKPDFPFIKNDNITDAIAIALSGIQKSMEHQY